MSRTIDAGPTFRLRALMRQLNALLPREGAEEMAEEAFRYAKWNWEKTNNRILPHGAWPGLRLASTAALIEIVKQQSSRRNPDPEVWTGTEKQINWAKSIREEARPVVEQWITEWREMDRKDRERRMRGLGWRHGGNKVGRRLDYLHFGNTIHAMRRGLLITDARFWIDNRTCTDADAFANAVRAYEHRTGTTLRLPNPGDYRVMPYTSAHRWEALAKAKGVSTVARSERGFMRMYERAGTWDNVNAYWRKRRAGFIARHMAQASSEQLWKRDKSGKLRPSRRALALIMWAYMPPGGPR